MLTVTAGSRKTEVEGDLVERVGRCIKAYYCRAEVKGLSLQCGLFR